MDRIKEAILHITDEQREFLNYILVEKPLNDTQHRQLSITLITGNYNRGGSHQKSFNRLRRWYLNEYNTYRCDYLKTRETN